MGTRNFFDAFFDRFFLVVVKDTTFLEVHTMMTTMTMTMTPRAPNIPKGPILFFLKRSIPACGCCLPNFKSATATATATAAHCAKAIVGDNRQLRGVVDLTFSKTKTPRCTSLCVDYLLTTSILGFKIDTKSLCGE